MLRSRWHRLLGAGLLVGAAACGSSSDGNGSGGSGGAAGGGGASSSSTSSGVGGSLDDGRCRTSDDCDTEQWEACLAEGESSGCGACFHPDNPCDDDAECVGQGEHFICEPVVCGCSATDKECRPGCQQDGDCFEAHLICDPTHRCVPKPCEAEDDCPQNFVCVLDADPTCTRDSCTTDGDCTGYCVKGRCYDQPGWCMGPAA